MKLSASSTADRLPFLASKAPGGPFLAGMFRQKSVARQASFCSIELKQKPTGGRKSAVFLSGQEMSYRSSTACSMIEPDPFCRAACSDHRSLHGNRHLDKLRKLVDVKYSNKLRVSGEEATKKLPRHDRT